MVFGFFLLFLHLWKRGVLPGPAVLWVQAGGQSSVLGTLLLLWLFPAWQLMAEMFPPTLPAVLWWQVGPGEASAAVLCRSVVFQAAAYALLLFGVLSLSELWSPWHSLLTAHCPAEFYCPWQLAERLASGAWCYVTKDRLSLSVTCSCFGVVNKSRSV